MPRRIGSNTPPIGALTAVVRIVPQESLPVVFGKVQLGTTGGAAAALPGKAIKPTPRAAAEARSNPIRLLVRIHLLLLRDDARWLSGSLPRTSPSRIPGVVPPANGVEAVFRTARLRPLPRAGWVWLRPSARWGCGYAAHPDRGRDVPNKEGSPCASARDLRRMSHPGRDDNGVKRAFRGVAPSGSAR